MIDKFKRYFIRLAVYAILVYLGFSRPVAAQESPARTDDTKPKVLVVVMDDIGYGVSTDIAMAGPTSIGPSFTKTTRRSRSSCC